MPRKLNSLFTPTEPKHGVCIRYFTPRPGVVDSIENEVALQRPNVYDAEIYVRPGDEVREVKSSLDRSGHVIVTADTVLEAINNAEELIKEIKINTL